MDNTLTSTEFYGFIGIAEADITPPVGIYLGNWGAATSPVATGIHRPLFMTCMTFQSEKEEDPLILLGLDLGWWKDRTDELLLRKKILDAFNLSSDRLLICLSHTHSGPSVCRKDTSRPGGHLIEPYLDRLEAVAISLIGESIAKAEKSILSWKYGQCDLAKNRDLKDPSKNRYLVGYNPEKPSDRTLLCGRITDESGRIMGTIVNYACHPTTLGWENTLISPDYIGSMRETIRQETVSPVFFIQGASGDLAPLIQYTGDVGVADRHGRHLGYAVLSLLESMPAPGTIHVFGGAVESGAPLAIWNEERINIPADSAAVQRNIRYSLKDFPDYAELEKTWIATDDPVQKERLWRKMGIRSGIGDGDESDIPLWVWKLGGAYIVAHPNEAYSIYQQTIRATLPGIPLVIGNLVNGSIGYFPPEDLYQEDIYAVWQTPFDSGCLEILIHETTHVLKKLEEEL